MRDGIQVHHLPRHEKKRLVKGWHASQPSVSATPSAPSDEPNKTDQMPRAESMRSLFAPPPGALAYGNQRTGTGHSVPDSIDELASDQDDLRNYKHEEKLPKTVGQVKHAYRSRARKQEAREASNVIRKREMYLELRRGRQQRKARVDSQHLATKALHHQDGESEDNEAASSPHDDFGGKLRLLDLPVNDIETNAAYRDEVLRQIRHQLASGGEVLLQSDCANLKESVRSTRLMLQTLCTHSLAYCVRDQSVVPETLSQLQPTTTRLILRLLPRHQH